MSTTTEQKIREMTYEELRDWWVTSNGANRCRMVPNMWHVAWCGRIGVCDCDGHTTTRIDHPLEDTIDAIKLCLPSGWSWTKYLEWQATKYTGKLMCVSVEVTDDEKCDRLRLACLARFHDASQH